MDNIDEIAAEFKAAVLAKAEELQGDYRDYCEYCFKLGLPPDTYERFIEALHREY